MGCLLKKSRRAPLPDNAEVFTRKGQLVARWRDGRTGRSRTAPVVVEGRDGSQCVSIEAKVWTMRYRDASGHIVERPTGCKDRDMAQRILSEAESRVEKIVGGVVTAAEDRAMDFVASPLGDHISDYINSLKARGVTSNTVKVSHAYLKQIAAGCRFRRITDLSRIAAERWLNNKVVEEGMGARSHNARVATLSAFGSWLERQGRIASNPFTRMTKRNEKTDARRPRRALTVVEVEKLLDAARRRPLEKARRISRGKHKGKLAAKLRPETVEQLKALGNERALFYSALLETGLRHGEARSITVAQAVLDGATPYLVLNAADEKSRRGAQIPLRPAFAKKLTEHLEYKLAAHRKAAQTAGKPIPARLPGNTPLFDVPKKMTKVFDADLAFAGIVTRDEHGKIQKQDDQGRSVDIHALRHTFGTMLSKAGTPLQIVQKAMRHSDPKLTMGTYSHLELLDVAGALEVLPDFNSSKDSSVQDATVQNANRNSPLNSPLNSGPDGHFPSSPGTTVIKPRNTDTRNTTNKKRKKCKGFQGLSPDGTEKEWWAMLDLNQRPLACQSKRRPKVTRWATMT